MDELVLVKRDKEMIKDGYLDIEDAGMHSVLNENELFYFFPPSMGASSYKSIRLVKVEYDIRGWVRDKLKEM